MPKILFLLMALGLLLSACQVPVATQDRPQVKPSAASPAPSDGFIYNVPWGKG